MTKTNKGPKLTNIRPRLTRHTREGNKQRDLTYKAFGVSMKGKPRACKTKTKQASRNSGYEQ